MFLAARVEDEGDLAAAAGQYLRFPKSKASQRPKLNQPWGFVEPQSCSSPLSRSTRTDSLLTIVFGAKYVVRNPRESLAGGCVVHLSSRVTD
jgi:hypothetical protein